MARKRYSDEDCLKILRQVELDLAGGADVAKACRDGRQQDGIIGGSGSALPLTAQTRETCISAIR